jgi:hypothetical protein
MRDLAEALGYRLARGRSNACPVAGKHGRGKLPLSVGADGWWCHACDEGGGPFNFIAWHEHGKAWSDLGGDQRDAVRALATELGAATPTARPRRPSSWGSLPVPCQWDRRGDPTPAPAALDWMRGRWGSEAVAAILADVGPPLVIGAAALPALRPAAEGYRLALPLHAWGGPRHGAVVSAAHRWCDEGDAPQGKERFVARSRTRLPAGAVVAFGDPGRISRFTHTIILAEGGGDWLAACGVVRLAGRSGAVEVLGLPGAGRAHAVGEALADHLRGILDGTMKTAKDGRSCRVEAQPIAGSWRVVLATDPDPAGDRAALELRGALGGLPVEVVRPRWERGIDLSDRLAEVGHAALWRELASANEWCAPAPPAPTFYGPDAMSLEEAREDGIRGEIDAALDDARGGARVALALPVGTGKTRAALDVIAARARQGERFMIAVATWAFGDELCSVIDTIAPDVEVAVWQGVSAACHDDEDAGILARSAWEDAGRPAHWGAMACTQCPLQSNCAAHQRADAPVVVVAHAMLPRLQAKALADRALIIDERPAAVSTRRWTVRALDRLGDGVGSAEHREADQLAAEESQRAAGAAWKPVHAALEDLALDRKRWGLRLDEGTDDTNAAIRRAIARANADPDALLEALDAGARKVKASAIPQPNVATMLRTGKAPARAVLPRDAHQLFALLARTVRRALGMPPAADDDGGGMLTVHLPADGAPCYERRDVLELPAGGAVFLDATAPAVPHVYNRLGVTIRTIAVEGDPNSETLRLFRRTKGLARSGLFRGGVGAGAVHRVLGELRFALGEVRARGPKRRRLRVGLLTYKPIADALEAEDVTGAWAELQREARRMGVEEVGYFGKDEEGTNRFEDCDCLVILGDPRPNLGARRSDLRALGIRDQDAQQKALGDELGETLAQAVGRARAETRAGFHAVAVIGATMPVTWDRRSVVELAKRPADAQRAAVTTAALTLAAMTGCAVTSWLVAVVELAVRRGANADIDNKVGLPAISVGPSSESLVSLRNRPEVGSLIEAASRVLREALPPGSKRPSQRTIRRGVEEAMAALRTEGWRVDTKPLPGRASWKSVYHPGVALEDARAIVGWLVIWRGTPAPLPDSARAAWAWWLDAAATVDDLAQQGDDDESMPRLPALARSPETVSCGGRAPP